MSEKQADRWKGLKKLLSPEESAALALTIEETECRTSAEIKVVIIRRCLGDLRDKAMRTFHKLGLDETEQRNCVMIMLATAAREFLIFGDEGIHEKVGQGFWDEVRDRMGELFRQGRFGEGLCEGVRMAGEKLAEHFPARAVEVDEISDEVAYE